MKCSMINKMPGLGFDKFANLKAGYAFMMGHSGKKLLFMGQDFAELREWSEERELDWYLLCCGGREPDRSRHLQGICSIYIRRTRRYMNAMSCRKDLSGSMRMTEREASSALSDTRKITRKIYCLYATLHQWQDRITVWEYPEGNKLKLVLNSDDKQYGGSGAERPLVYKPKKQECDGRPYSIGYDLPPYGVAVFEF